MKFGVLQFFSWPERRVALETVYQRALDRVQVMDESGYDAVWLAEHHFSTYSVCPSVHMMGTLVAARTKQLRIGMAVSLAAMYHPLRLAEEVALLDVISGGRVNWGAGRGFDPTEFRAFGLTNDTSRAKFQENVEIVLEAWRSERLTYHGEFYDFENIEVLPKPLQDPHPPVWVAATSPPAVAWAAQAGHTILMDPHSSHEDLGAKRRDYQRQLEAAGHSMAGREIPMARLIALGDTEAEARAVAENGAKWTVGSYANPKGSAGASAFTRPDAPPMDPVQRYIDQVIITGTPGSVVDKLKQLESEMLLDYLLCAPLSHKSFVLFTEKVLPRLV